MPLLKKTVLNVSFPPWMAVVLVSSVFALQTRSSKMNKDVHFKTATDGGGSTQKQVCLANLRLKNEQGGSFLSEDGSDSMQKRVRLRTRSPKIDKEVNFWARMAVVKRLNLGRALPTVL